jgi:cyclopropane fatty-acyl-phospholipid synthase-like methyltransferase
MANRPSNRRRNDWTVELLGIQPGHRVLEIGFGPGIALQRASSLVGDGEVVGIDRSETMRRQAAARNQGAITAGRLRLICSTLDAESPALGRFDRIYSVNVVQFWKDPAQVYALLRSLLRPGGVIATTYQPRHRGATAADAERKADSVAAWLTNAGFAGTQVHRLDLQPVPAVCIIATAGNHE